MLRKRGIFTFDINRKDDVESNDFSAFFPHFVWALRDNNIDLKGKNAQ